MVRVAPMETKKNQASKKNDLIIIFFATIMYLPRIQRIPLDLPVHFLSNE